MPLGKKPSVVSELAPYELGGSESAVRKMLRERKQTPKTRYDQLVEFHKQLCAYGTPDG